MKKTSIVLVWAVLGFAMVGCSSEKDYDKNPFNEEVKRFYEAPHQLRKMFVKEVETTVKEPGRGHISGGFFLFMGGISGDYKEGTETKSITTHVRFAWEIKDNTYIITTLPLERVRIKIVKNIEAPTISFFLDKFAVDEAFHSVVNRWAAAERQKIEVERGLGRIFENYFNPNGALSNYLVYATITVKSENWPANINLPVNQGFSN